MTNAPPDALREAAINDPEVPDVVRSFLGSGADLESIILDADGRWWHRGAPFEHPRLIEAFSRAVRRTERGTWLVQLGTFVYPVQVEDCGRFVRSVRTSDAPWTLVLTSGQEEALDPHSLCTDGATFLGCRLTDGQLARFVGGAYQALLSRVSLADGAWIAALPGGPFPITSRPVDPAPDDGTADS